MDVNRTHADHGLGKEITMHAYQAITTKYIPWSNVKSSRIKAFTESGKSATIGYPHEYSGVECHFQAVKALLEKLNKASGNGWGKPEQWIPGATKAGYVWVFPATD